MARAIDGDELLGIERLLDTDVVRQSKTASWLLDQVLHDIQAMSTLIPSNNPLTLEQLREMDRFSPPIYDICLNEWCCVREDACAGDIGVSYIGGGTRPLEENRFYPFPLPHIDRETWEPCKVCNGKKTLYQHTNTTKLFMNTFGRAAALEECKGGNKQWLITEK